MWLKLKVRNLQKFVIKAMGILQFGKIVLKRDQGLLHLAGFSGQC